MIEFMQKCEVVIVLNCKVKCRVIIMQVHL